ncbi:imelysin family protein [Halocola ammonii]
MKEALRIVSIVFISFLLLTCGENSSEKAEIEAKSGVSKKDVTEHFGKLFEEMIQKMQTDLDRFEIEVDSFQNEPTVENLEALQTEWKNLTITVQQSSFLNVGPIKTKYGFLPINYWPVNSVKIDQVLTGNDQLDSEFMAKAGNSIKGVWALEDLLFDKEKSQMELINEFAGPNGAQRFSFVEAQVDYLRDRLKVLEQLWTDYRPSFSKNEGSGTNEPFSLVINRITSELERIKNESLAKPMGLSLGGEPAPTLIKGYESESGILMIRNELAGTSFLFNTDKNGPSLAQMVNSKDQGTKLVSRINSKFDEARDITDGFDIPLSQAVVEQPDKVRQLHETVQDLIVLFKTEVTSTLGVTITFNDMDGD